jgi:hypothetical protein
MRRTLAVVGLVGMLAGLVAAQEIQSGTQPGQVLPGPFRAFAVTGQESKPMTEGVLSEERQNLGDVARVGKIHDFVTRYGLDPTVAVFAREIPSADQPLGKLLKSLDQAVEKNRAARLRAFAIFLGLKAPFYQDETQPEKIKAIQALAQQLQLNNVPLALDLAESERTKAYQLAPEAMAVVLLYVNQKVQARYAFGADKALDDGAVQEIMAEVTKLIGARR